MHEERRREVVSDGGSVSHLSQERRFEVDTLQFSVATQQFLNDLQPRRSVHTLRAYATDLRHLKAWLESEPCLLSGTTLQHYFATHPDWAAATVSRKHSTLQRFSRWALRKELLLRDPTLDLEHVRLPPPHPRGLRREQIEQIFAQMDTSSRDALLFRLVFETGLRIGEALGLHLDDLDLTRGDEHLTVLGKGERKRTVLLDDPVLVVRLRKYLKNLDYTHGPLFQATRNGRGGALRYQSVQSRWQAYTEGAGIPCTLHQLRHSHATELVNGGVSLATIRKRLGHQHLQTTLRYAEISDQTADAELRTWRRKQHHDK